MQLLHSNICVQPQWFVQSLCLLSEALFFFVPKARGIAISRSAVSPTDY